MIPKTGSKSPASSPRSKPAETQKPAAAARPTQRRDEMSTGRGAALRAKTSKYLMADPGGGGGGKPPEYRSTTDALNLRPTPSATGSQPIAIIPANTTLKVTPDAAGQTRKDGFVHVSWNDAGTARDGWVSEQWTAPAKAPAVTPPPASVPAGSVVYTSDVLNLRPAPGKDNTPLAVIPGGSKLDVTADPATGKTREGEFLHVSWNDGGTKRDGWVYEPFTTKTPTAAGPTPSGAAPPVPAGPETVFVDAGGSTLGLRAGPSTSTTKLAAIPDGTQLEVTPDATGTTRKDGFVHVTYDLEGVKTDGWVSEQYTQPGAIADAKDIHINQFDAEKLVTDVNGATGDGTNQNCGPAAVVIALRDQGLTIPPVPGTTQTGDGADVQAARYWAYQGVDAAKDGVAVGKDGALGFSSTKGGENSTITYFTELQNAVTAAGGKANWLDPANSSGVATALANGQSVVLSGNFLDEDGKGKTDVWARGGGAKEHVVAVTGMTADGRFILNDPALKQPVVVTAAQLDSFMSNNAGGLTVSQ
ncbi:MAG: SH3 domain-containing protein [Archangium sp.]|nr:SH3 domain-containing protein [Archangium sp.]